MAPDLENLHQLKIHKMAFTVVKKSKAFWSMHKQGSLSKTSLTCMCALVVQVCRGDLLEEIERDSYLVDMLG